MPLQHWKLETNGNWKANAATNPPAPPINSRDTLVYGDYKPDAATTGVLEGVPLTVMTTAFTTPADNMTYENMDFQQKVVVNKSGVTFKNCYFRGGDPTVSSPLVQAWTSVATQTKFYDCTFAPNNPVVYHKGGIQTTDCELHRCDIYSTVDGVKTQYGDVEVYGCWIHDLPRYEFDPEQTDGSHNDGIQCEGGGGNHIFRGNRIEVGYKATSGIIVTQNVGNLTGIIIDKNWITSTVLGSAPGPGAGLNFTEKGLGAMTNVVITNNKFSDANTWKNNKVAFIDSNTYDLATISNNTYESTGLNAPFTRVNV